MFLYNYTQRNLLGIYRAASDGLLNYNSDAWPRLACLLRPKCTEVLLGAVGAGCGLTLLVLAVAPAGAARCSLLNSNLKCFACVPRYTTTNFGPL